MALDRGKLANVDRRLLAELDRGDDWQLVKVRASPATWSAWKRYCEVVGLSMGRAIAALIDLEMASVVDDDVDAHGVVIAERKRLLDERARELDKKEAELERREERFGYRHRPSPADLEHMADQIEPADPGWTAQESSDGFDPSVFVGVGRNERCPCDSGLKFKKCHLLLLKR